MQCWFPALVEQCPGVTTSRPLDSLLFSGGTRALARLGSSRLHHLVSVQMLSFLANRLHSPRVLGSSFSPAFLWPSRAQAFPSRKVRLSSGQTPALGSAALPRPEVVRCLCLLEAHPPPCSPLSFDTRPPHLRDGDSSFPTARVQIQNQFLKLEFNCFTILY